MVGIAFNYSFNIISKSSFVMRGFASIVSLFAASAALVSAGAQGNPHAKAAKYAKRSVAPIVTKDAYRTRSTSMYLNKNTASKLISGTRSFHTNSAQNSRSMGVHFLTSTLISANHTQELFQ